MRVFSHISEFGLQGMETLPALLTVSDRVSLWSPSAPFIEAAATEGHSYLTPRDVLDLVESGHVQIMGRRRWFFDRGFRDDHPAGYRYASWDASYDVALQHMALQDENLPEVNRRVFYTGDEEGAAYATAAIGSNDPRHVADVNHAQRVLRGGLTRGLQQKLDAAAPEEALAIVIRDLHNHRRAFEDARADRVLVHADDADSYASAVADIGVGEPADDASADRLPELVEFIAAIARPRNGAELLELLQSTDMMTLRREAGELLHADRPIDEEVLRKVVAGTRIMSWTDVISDRDPWTAFTRLGFGALGLLLAMAHFELATPALVALAIQASQVAHPILEKTGIARAPGYSGPALPFILAYDRSSPTYRDINAMVEGIHKLRGEV